MTKLEFAAFIASLRKALPRFAPDMDDRQTLDLWFQELGGMSTEEANHVYRSAIRTMDAFPSIRQVLELAGRGERTDEEKGREVAERMWAAIGKLGYIAKPERLLEFIGPIGVEVVRLQGGWKHLCEIATFDNATTLKAQWRELAVIVAKKARADQLDAPPDFAKLPEKAQAALKTLDAKWTLGDGRKS